MQSWWRSKISPSTGGTVQGKEEQGIRLEHVLMPFMLFSHSDATAAAALVGISFGMINWKLLLVCEQVSVTALIPAGLMIEYIDDKEVLQ